MFYISLITCLFVVLYDWNYLFYLFIAYTGRELIKSSIQQHYWLGATDYNIILFGYIVYLAHFLYLYLSIDKYYNNVYYKLSYVDTYIDAFIKKILFNKFIKFNQNNKIIHINKFNKFNKFNNILEQNLKLIIYIEELNINDNRLKLLIYESKFKINKYLKLNQINDIINDIKLKNT